MWKPSAKVIPMISHWQIWCSDCSRINRSFYLNVHTHVWTHVDTQGAEEKKWRKSRNLRKNVDVHRWITIIWQDNPHCWVVKMGVRLKENIVGGERWVRKWRENPLTVLPEPVPMHGEPHSNFKSLLSLESKWHIS